MFQSIELQVISKLLSADIAEKDIDTLCAYDASYYSAYREHIQFIYNHKLQYGTMPDRFTFQAQFPDVSLVTVNESIEYLCTKLSENKAQLILIDTFNTVKDMGSGDVQLVWDYIRRQCDAVSNLNAMRPLDIVHDAKKRSEQILQFSQQSRIPTGFPEIDKLMYGGLSTVEELLLIIARTNTGKSWVCTKMMESAQKHGFPVLYYSPEMQASFIGTRFDTWRNHFQNSQLYRGNYTDDYKDYLTKLSQEQTSAFVLEDKDVSNGSVNVESLSAFVQQHGIKLLVIDGISYMNDVRKSDTEYIKYKNICLDLFKLSKRNSCAVVVAVQANRESVTKKDDKGDSFPSIHHIEGSDHPGRICTQAFSLRQIFDRHVLDIRLEKSRMANNQNPIFSYAWDINTGNMQYLPDSNSEADTTMPVTPLVKDLSIPANPDSVKSEKLLLNTKPTFSEDVEF